MDSEGPGDGGRPGVGAAEPRRAQLWAAYVSGAFGLAISAQGNFLVSLRATEMGASIDVVGVIVGIGALAPAVLSVASGAVIDRLGPRSTFILGAASTAVISALFVLVTDYRWFLLLQPLAGITRNFGWVASQSYITGLGPQHRRAAFTGRFSFFSNVSTMLAPALAGGVAQVVGLRWALLVPACYATFFALLGLMLATPEGHGQARVAQGTGSRSAVHLLTLRRIQLALLLSFTRLWITLVHGTFVPVYLVQRGFEPGLIGMVMATSGLVAALIAPTVAVWTRFGSPEIVAGVSLAFGAVGLALVPHLAWVPLVFLPAALLGVGGGLSLPLLLTLVADAAPPGLRGVALGLRGMANQVSSAAAPVVVGPLIAATGFAVGFSAGAVLAGAMLAGAHALHLAEGRARRAT